MSIILALRMYLFYRVKLSFETSLGFPELCPVTLDIHSYAHAVPPGVRYYPGYSNVCKFLLGS
jgi:hypothetical protein